MEIEKILDGATLTIALDGRLDTTTSPELEDELSDSLDNVTELIFDFEKLEYISSSGLRILLSTVKTMNKQGRMVIKNANQEIIEVFEVTGFIDILCLE